RKQGFRDTQVLLVVLDAGDYYRTDLKRPQPVADVDQYKALSAVPDGALVSENFALLHKVAVGDTVTLTSPPVRLKVVGTLVDYSWNHGTLVVNQDFYERQWQDGRGVDVFDVYLTPGADAASAREE